LGPQLVAVGGFSDGRGEKKNLKKKNVTLKGTENVERNVEGKTKEP